MNILIYTHTHTHTLTHLVVSRVGAVHPSAGPPPPLDAADSKQQPAGVRVRVCVCACVHARTEIRAHL